MVAETHPDIRRTLLFFIKEDQILLAMKMRGFGAGKWNGVGGKIEPGESIEDAMVRESIEEVSMKPLSWQKVAELDFVQDATTDPWHMFVHAYISYEWEGVPTESEEMKPQWFNFQDIPYADMWDDDELWLQRVLEGETLKGSFTFDAHDKMVAHKVEKVEKL